MVRIISSQRKWTFFIKQSKLRLLNIFLILFVLAVIPLTFILLQRTQDIREHAESGSPYLQTVELAYNQGAGDGQGNGWGPHASRIVRTSNGDIYSTVTTADPTQPSNYYFKNWQILKRDHTTGQWSASTASGSQGNDVFTPPLILRGSQDQLYVFSTPNMQPKFWNSITNTDVSIPGNWYLNPHQQTGTQESTYPAAGIDSAGELYFTMDRLAGCTFPDIPGTYDFGYLAPGSSTWAMRTNYVVPNAVDDTLCLGTQDTNSADGRNEYYFLFPTSAATMTMVGTTDLSSAEFGWPAANNNVNYYFDGINIFTMTSVSSQPASPLRLPNPLHPTTFVEDGSNDPNVRFFARDVYQDTQGRTHIIYDFTGPDTNDVWTDRHAIIQNGQVIKDVQITIPYMNYGKIIQDTEGNFYLFSVGPGADGKTCTMYLQQGASGDTDGTNLLPEQTMILQSSNGATYDCSTAQNNFIAAPRGGTPLADYVDGAVAANNGIDWVYYRLQLHGGSAPTTSSTPTTTPTPTSQADGKITIQTASNTFTVGDTFTAYVVLQASNSFKAASANISASSNLHIQSIDPPADFYGPCHFDTEGVYSITPTISNPSFSATYNQGFGSSSCTLYTMTVQVTGSGAGSIFVTNGSLTSLTNQELFSQAVNGSYILNPTQATVIPGDLNGDGVVDLFDVSILLSNWNTSNSVADINRDNIVNLLDLSILLSHWGG